MLSSDVKLYGCCKCLRKFALNELSVDTQLCKECRITRTSSSYKQCAYCKSDFKQSLPGVYCPKCKSLEDKHGHPKPCTICTLPMAFGSGVCLRCNHYRGRFGEPTACESCKQPCAFVKDEVGRSKVDGQVLCWVCTYNHKLAKSRDRSSRRVPEGAASGSTDKRSRNAPKEPSSNSGLSALPKRSRVDDYQASPTMPAYSMDNMYNEHLLTIGQLQEEIKTLRKQLSQKESALLGKDRTIAELRSDILHMEGEHREKVVQLQRQNEDVRAEMSSKIRELQRENATLAKSARKKGTVIKTNSQSNSRNNSP